MVGALVCTVLGAGLGWCAVVLWRKTSTFLFRAVRTGAIVVELVTVGGEDTVAPKYSFRDRNGRERTAVSKSSSYPARYSVGQQIFIFFEEESGESRLDDWMDLRGAETLVGVLAGASLAAGAVCLALGVL